MLGPTEKEVHHQMARFEAHLEKFVGSIEPRVDAPKVLYHYTNTEGLLGIIKDSNLRATDCRFLNDSSEATYARDIIAKHLKKLSSNRAFKHLDLINIVLDMMLPEMTHMPYVTCFCSKDDLLNQWRVYADTQGYSIGFESSALRRYGTTLRHVLYSERLQQNLVKTLVACSARFMEDLFASQDYDTEVWDRLSTSLGDTLAWYISMTVLGFKHPSFAVEHEWRLLSIDPRGNAKIQHRAGAYGLTPYILHGPTETGELLPISSITHGPTSSPTNAKAAITTLLAQRGYNVDEIDVRGSKLPIRV